MERNFISKVAYRMMKLDENIFYNTLVNLPRQYPAKNQRITEMKAVTQQVYQNQMSTSKIKVPNRCVPNDR